MHSQSLSWLGGARNNYLIHYIILNMENSVECNNDDMLFFPCEDIVSTSVEDRSIVFAEIERCVLSPEYVFN